MDHVKDALEYVAGLAVGAEKPEQVTINGRTYCTKSLVRYDRPDMAEPIKATTLTSLVDYIKESREELRERMIIQITDPTEVLLYSGLTAERDREMLFKVNALLPRFDFGSEYGQERFLIALQSCFEKNDDRELVSLFAGNVVDTQEAVYSDDGVTQQAVMRTGVANKENVIVPNAVHLVPYRTFIEVGQPGSDFIFRAGKGKDDAPTFKLVSADGGLWKSQALANVKNYLMEALEGIPNRGQITIIA